jgi:hypothetical protein
VVKQLILLVVLVVATACHAFTDADEFGPAPGPGNAEPNNGGTNIGPPNNGSTNGVPNNFLPNNSAECVPASDCDFCFENVAYGCEEVFQGCLVPTVQIDCGDATCVGGECMNDTCPFECDPGENSCDSGIFFACVTVGDACTVELPYPCDPMSCTTRRCDIEGQECAVAAETRCVSETELFICSEDSPQVWKFLSNCPPDEYCNPESNECGPFEDLFP